MRRLILRATGGATTKRRTKRRRSAPRWLRATLYAAAAALLFGGSAFGGYWTWTSGTVPRLAAAATATMVDASLYAGLAIEEILVEGRVETTRTQLLRTIAAERGDPILMLDTDAVRERLIRLGWVADAVVERRFPGTVYVRIWERQAMAIWQRNGKLALVDRGGAVIGTQGLDRYAHLTVIVGDAAPRHAPALLDMLATAPKLMKRVRAASWIGNRRWNLRLDDGIDIRLPEENPHAAWMRLVALERDRRLLSRDIMAIDLRLRDRLVVRMREGARPIRRRRSGST